MWSHTQGRTWTAPYFNPDLPSPICEGDMILGAHTPAGLGVEQPLFFNPQQSGRPEAEHVPETFSCPAVRHHKRLPERGKHVLMTGNSTLALIRRQQALFIV